MFNNLCMYVCLTTYVLLNNTFMYYNIIIGTYYPLTGMSDEVQQQLIDDHFLFKEGDRFLQVKPHDNRIRWTWSDFSSQITNHTHLKAANASRYWPTGRGIFHNEEKTFLVWVGEEDHLRIISMAPGGDVGRVFQLLIDGIEHMDSLMSFTSDERLGWLTFCPTNLGTAIRASVHIKLPLLARGGMEALQEVADQWQLQVFFANILGFVNVEKIARKTFLTLKRLKIWLKGPRISRRALRGGGGEIWYFQQVKIKISLQN